jgi:hypothetical protein
MVSHWQYWNPVQITFGINAFDQLKHKIAVEKPYAEWLRDNRACLPHEPRLKSACSCGNLSAEKLYAQWASPPRQ